MDFNDIVSFNILDSIPSSIFVIDSNYSLVYWNFAMRSLNSTFNNQNKNKSIFKLFPNLESPLYKLRIDSVLDGGPPTFFSSQFHKYLIPCEASDGTFRIHHTSVNAFKFPSSSKKYLIFSIQDVTAETKQIAEVKAMRDKAYTEIVERKKTEKELRNIQKKLKELNANKDKFFSIISHDLKSPFNGLLGIANLLISDYDELSPLEIREMIELLQSSSSNIYELLEGLLEWAQTQTGRIEYKFENINVYDMSMKMMDLLKITALNKNISLENRVKENTFVYADEKSINTVLRNLIANAIKFTEPGGVVKIDTENNDDEIVISVMDSGIGISEDNIRKLFRIEIHHTTVGTNNESGTGVGLILCKELVEKQGGSIWVESEFGKGSTFKFTLPCNL